MKQMLKKIRRSAGVYAVVPALAVPGIAAAGEGGTTGLASEVTSVISGASGDVASVVLALAGVLGVIYVWRMIVRAGFGR